MTCFNTQHYNYSNMATWGGFDRINEAVLRFHLLQFLLQLLLTVWTSRTGNPTHVSISFPLFLFRVEKKMVAEESMNHSKLTWKGATFALSYSWWCCFNIIIIIIGGVSCVWEVVYDWFSIFVVFSKRRNFVIGFFLVGKTLSLADMRPTGSSPKQTSRSRPLWRCRLGVHVQ